MNLMLHSFGVEIPLRQTPTSITWMCLSYNPITLEPDGGMEGVRRRYLLWLDGTLTGKWDSIEDLNYAREDIKEHKAKIMEVQDPQFSFI